MSRLGISWCIICKKNPISEETFPHYCPVCIAIIQSGEAPVSVMFQDSFEKEAES